MKEIENFCFTIPLLQVTFFFLETIILIILVIFLLTIYYQAVDVD